MLTSYSASLDCHQSNSSLYPESLDWRLGQISYTESSQKLQQSYLSNQNIQLSYRTENSSWNVLCLLLSEVAYIGTGHYLP